MSAPLLSILYARAEKMFLGLARWSELAEPLSATFCREMVDGNNKTVLTAAQAAALVAGGGGGSAPPLRLFAIPNNVDSFTVTGLALASVPTQALCSVMKTWDGVAATGSETIFASPRSGSFTTDGFIVDLSGRPDSTGYTLVFLVG